MAEFMTGMKRTDYCGDLRIGDVGREVTVCGWVQRCRDLGQLIFIDLRDRTGIVQLAFNDKTDKEIFDKAFSCRSEFVLAAKGVVCERSSKNSEIPTGDIEVVVSDMRVLSKAQTPPFEIVDDTNTNEELRLKYRYLDLRRRPLLNNLMMRSKIAKVARDYFHDNGFVEIETPMMIKSTPEGARDYLVPSRIHNGKFYALPQSPQIYKQLSTKQTGSTTVPNQTKTMPSSSPDPSGPGSKQTASVAEAEARALADPFATAWNAYPRHTGSKNEAEKAWNLAIQGVAGRPPADPRQLIASAIAYAKTVDDPRYAPNMSRWLRQGAYMDTMPDQPKPYRHALPDGTVIDDRWITGHIRDHVPAGTFTDAMRADFWACVKTGINPEQKAKEIINECQRKAQR